MKDKTTKKESNNKQNDKEHPKETPYNPDLVAEDIQAIGKKGLSLKRKDDRLLMKRTEPIDFTGNDLDVPKAESSKGKASRLKDEENTLYGEGGENKEHLETPNRANLSPKKKQNP